MRKIQFQFANFGVFEGCTDGANFMGHPTVYVTENVRRDVVEVLRNVKDLSLTTEKWIEEVSQASKSWGDNRIAFWGLPVTFIKSASLFEYTNVKPMTDAKTVQEVLLDGHYYDIIVNHETDIPAGSTRIMRDKPDWRVTHHGTFKSVDEARMKLNIIGEVSGRSSRMSSRPDHEVMKGAVLERWYACSQNTVGDLSAFIRDLPPEVLGMTEGQVKVWASLVLDEARKTHRDIFWYLGAVPLEIRVRKEAAIQANASYLDQ